MLYYTSSQGYHNMMYMYIKNIKILYCNTCMKNVTLVHEKEKIKSRNG